MCEGIQDSGNAGQRHNMYVGYNRWRYVILQETISEGIFCVRRLLVGEV